MVAAMASAAKLLFRDLGGASMNTQSTPMAIRNGKAISFVVPARTKSKATSHDGARNKQAAVKARIRKAEAISPKVECEYQSSGLVIVTRTPVMASAADVFFFSVKKITRTEPSNDRKLR